jgi:predicted RNase H-like HicB family nuclease
MEFYYAIFRKTSEAIEVEFPDLRGCVTFGRTRDEAIENATDVLAGWLANAESQFVKEPSSYEALKNKFKNDELISIAVDENIMQQYEASKKFNVVFPATLLSKVDQYTKEKGLKRSLVLRKATEEYLQKQSIEA